MCGYVYVCVYVRERVSVCLSVGICVSMGVPMCICEYEYEYVCAWVCIVVNECDQIYKQVSEIVCRWMSSVCGSELACVCMCELKVCAWVNE